MRAGSFLRAASFGPLGACTALAAAGKAVVAFSAQHLEVILRAPNINGGSVGFEDINALRTGEK